MSAIFGEAIPYVEGLGAGTGCAIGSWSVDPSWPASASHLTNVGIPTVFTHNGTSGGTTSFIYAPITNTCLPFSVTYTATLVTPDTTLSTTGAGFVGGMSMTSPPSLASSFVSASVIETRSTGGVNEGAIPFGDVYLQIASINGGFGPSGTDRLVANSDIGDVGSATYDVSIRIEVYDAGGFVRARFKLWLTSDGEPPGWQFNTGGTSGIPHYVYMALSSASGATDYSVGSDLTFTCAPPCGGVLVSTLDINELNPEGYVP